jgi:hypothetical protein
LAPFRASKGDVLMLKTILSAVIAATLIAATAAPSYAEEKKLTAQQQKMKDCGPKWADYKKANNVKGRTEYRKFMKTCLKG